MGLEQAVVDLSSVEDGVESRRAATAILDCEDPSGQIDRMYLPLLKNQTLLTAMAHLERAGADLESLTLSTSLFRNCYPLNVLLPLADHIPADRIALAAVRKHLSDHLLLLDRVATNMASVGEDIPVVFLFGRAIRAAYPAYPHRVGYDIDVLTPHLEAGVRLVRHLGEHFGTILFHCKVSRPYLGWLAHFGCRTRTGNGHILSIDVIARGRPFGEGPGLLPPVLHGALLARLRRVEWSGRRVWVPSAEDMLLTLADKIHRHGWISRKDFNDARVILGAENGALDWGYLRKEAVEHRLGGILHALMSDAESRAERRTVPADFLARLAPGRSEKEFLRFTYPEAGPQRRRAGFLRRHALKFWTLRFLLKYAGSSLRHARIAVLVIRDNFQRRMFRRELRLAEAGAAASAPLPSTAGRGGAGSFCQLRPSAAAPGDAYCLSHDAGRGIAAPPAGMDAASFQLLGQIAELVPLPADYERACARMDRRIRTLLRMTHDCSSYSFVVGAAPVKHGGDGGNQDDESRRGSA